MRIAAIDIGTNSIHMIVVKVRPDLSFEVIDREKDMVRLGAGGLDGRNLTPTAMAAALQTLTKFRRLAETHKVDEIIASATSATREAENGGDFVAEVDRQTGIRIKVISGTEEARLIHLAAGYGVDVGGNTAVVVDIGGGSVEVTLGTATQMALGKSFKIGVIRLTERFVKSDPISGRDERRLVKHINREMGAYFGPACGARIRPGHRNIRNDSEPGRPGIEPGGGPGRGSEKSSRAGTIAPQAPQAPHRVQPGRTSRHSRAGSAPRRPQRRRLGSVRHDHQTPRAPRNSPSAISRCAKDWFSTTSTATAPASRKVERYPDVSRRSVVELGERCGYWSDHAQHVARLALAIFDQTRSVHGLGDRERDWLEYGALLHDIGVHISYERHNRHSYYLIKNGDLRGFDPQEIEAIALIARYHRQGTPKKSHEGYGDLPGSSAAPSRRCRPWYASPRASTAATPRRSPASISIRAATTISPACARPAMRSSSCGRRTGTWRHSNGCSASRYVSKSRGPTTRTARLMLTNLTTPHEYPGKLFVVEGIDGSGKTTQLALLAKWLSAAGHPVFVTEWNSSALVKAATKTGKKKNSLTPMTFSLLHATDFADRLLYNIIPPLKAGMIVLADRYTYTAFARDAARGVDRRWVRELYSFAVKPDLAVYFRVPIEVSTDRLLARRVKLKFYEAGMDMGWSSNLVESFRMFQGKVLDEYDRLVEEFGLSVVNAVGSITDQQRTFRKLVSAAPGDLGQ